MPTYQYACTACGHQLEAVQSFTDEPLTECPACEGKLRKVFSAVGVVFKGSGFYRTDSRSNSSSSSSTVSSTNGGETTKKASESKPAASTSSDKKPAGSTTAS
ncbi:FmdB family zinc ribbon protein [Planosporangium mesophilum]|uniref:FmdB family transcriptional regulator n=1 Tax=Planosporangium mesophilum TaxID=689768 RepID=A0A8J3T8K5_9ACTN|nr:FmdB family zinc ribbon protein [Planosporangium mesophilum]NJC81083.1 FmdB family transcriptional regulator [Planosporangium mesophilum]GII21272.1 FmdB family transcriptional regulator [Planosporangium mesophilum]